MSEELRLILVSSGFLTGIIGLLLYVARLVFTGKYYPSTWVSEQREHYNEQLTREREIGENYRLAAQNNVEALKRQGDLLERVLEGQDFVKDFVTSLRQAMEAEGGERNVPPRRRS